MLVFEEMPECFQFPVALEAIGVSKIMGCMAGALKW